MNRREFCISAGILIASFGAGSVFATKAENCHLSAKKLRFRRIFLESWNDELVFDPLWEQKLKRKLQELRDENDALILCRERYVSPSFDTIFEEEAKRQGFELFFPCTSFSQNLNLLGLENATFSHVNSFLSSQAVSFIAEQGRPVLEGLTFNEGKNVILWDASCRTWVMYSCEKNSPEHRLHTEICQEKLKISKWLDRTLSGI